MTPDAPEQPVGGLAVRAPAGVELRPVGRSDLVEAVRLARAQHGLPPLDDVAALRAPFEALLDSVDVVPFLAVDHDRAIGLGILHFRRRLNFPTFEGWVSELCVDEPARGRGVGRALLDALIAEWRLRGSHRLQAKLSDGASAAAGLYAAAGLHDWMLDFRLRPVVAPALAATPEVTIRPATDRDIERVTALISQFGAPRTPAAERIEAVHRTFSAHLADMTARRSYLAVAELDDVVAGVCAIEWQRPFWADEVHGWLPDLIVDEARRGRGIGRALVADALQHANAVGATEVSLESGARREAAHRLYRSLGFVESGHTWLLRKEAS